MGRFLAGVVAGLAVLPLGAAIAARLGRLPVAATADPPGWEARFARSAVRATLSREAARLAAPAGGTEQDLIAGMSLYRSNCAGCHGEKGRPSPWGTTSFYPRVPQLADVPTPLTAPEIFVAVKHGIRYSGMGAWEGLMPERDIWKVAVFLSRVASLPPSVEARWSAKS
jgi:mono/diheme cytochrome c family protein